MKAGEEEPSPHASGSGGAAVAATCESHPDLLAGTVTAARASGRTALALEQAERLAALFPEDPRIRRLVEELREEAQAR